MGGGPGGSQRPDERPRSGVSRRRFLAGGLVAIGGSSALANGATEARFSDSEQSFGNDVRIDGDPTLNYQIIDEAENTNAEYQIGYQVEWVADFDRIEIQVENLDAGHIDGQTYTQTSPEVVVDYPQGGGHEGGAGGDRYQFTFDVYDSSDTVVINEVVEDDADGDGQSEGDFGNANSSSIDSFTVDDQTDDSGTRYVVSYVTSNFDSSYTVRGRFENQEVQDDWPDGSDTNSSANGDLVFPTSGNGYEGGTVNETYRITVEILDSNDLVVDSAWVEDTPGDGNDSSYP